MTDADALQYALGLLATGGFALAGFALKRANKVDVLATKQDGFAEKLDELMSMKLRQEEALQSMQNDLSVLRTQINGVNGNNGLNGSVKAIQAQIEHMRGGLEDIKAMLIRLDVTLQQLRETP